uniref:CA domain-containing protein n=1 Tax=Gongylonema pulchrum TaxID=637853 RepID=A0A183F099_9BILA
LLENGFPLLVRAIDHDSGINGLISYRLLSPSDPYFTVDYVSGAILTKSEIDYEKVKQWSFYVQASDFGSSTLTSALPALVHVTVRDVNDVPPKFVSKNYTANLLLPTLKGSFQ